MIRSADVLLADGTAAHLRSLTPDDADAVVALHSRFSDRTRYLRYFSPYPRIPPADLHRFTNLDHRDREALAIWIGEQLVAIGRYDRLGQESPEAEVAFAVEDAHQGRGIGSVLLEHLAAAALPAGITRFVAEVLPENAAMLRVFADAGYEVTRQFEEGVVHLTFPIAPTERSREVQWVREQRAEAASITPLLAPSGIVVYGVRRDGTGIGASLLANLRDGGYPGTVAVVHPVLGVRSATEVDGPVDLAVVATPAAAVPQVLTDAARAGVRGVVVVSAGFAEAGEVGAQQELIRSARAHGMRVVGPNCFGIANTDPAVLLNATLAPRLPAAGRAALFSHSGAFGIALLAEADRRGVGLSSFVAAGNRADVSGNDLLQFWRDDPRTDVILLYLESFGNPRKFARLAREVGRTKPVVAVAPRIRPAAGEWRLGGASEDRSRERPRAQSAPSAPAESAKTALFTHSGVIRVHTVAELFDAATLLAHQPLPAGDRVGIVTNSSALGALAAAACPPAGLTVADGYPVDAAPQAAADAFADALERAVADPETDALVVAGAPPAPPATGEQFAQAVSRAAGRGDKPVVTVFLTGSLPPEVPAYPSVEEAVQALARVAGYARWRREPAGAMPELPDVDPDAAAAALADGRPLAALAAYGISAVPLRRVDSAEAAQAAADELGYPVAVAAADTELRHRADLGAVWLDLSDPDAVARAYAAIAGRFGPAVTVQPMAPPGIACVVEVTQDPAFGPVVGFGLGGVATELLDDRAWRLAPLTDRDAHALVRAPRAAPLLRGYLGGPPVDQDALAELLLRVGRLADEQPRLRSLALKPVLARPDGLSVLHADAELGEPTARPDTGPRGL